MLRNYLVFALRNILRQKGYSLLNIIGLAIGLSTALLIYIWVYDEVSTDRFHENIDNIYRVEQDQYYNGEAYHVTVTPYPSGEGWKNEIPEIIESVRGAFTGSLLFRSEEKKFYENRLLAVDSSFFQVFTFPLIHGDPDLVLTQPLSLVMTERMALKYFGDENPVGQTIELDNQYHFTITGVVSNPPDNSSLDFDFLAPFDFTRTLGMYNDGWGNNSIQTFVVLNPDADPVPVDEKLTDVVFNHRPNLTMSRDEYETNFMLAPMKRMYLHSYFGFGHSPGRIVGVRIFALIGLVIILIAAINYMNLATARSSRRAREIGLRKVSGATRGQVTRQFMGESLINVIISMIIAVVGVALLLDVFRTISGKEVGIDFLISLPFIIGIFCVTVLTALLAGFYPSLFLSRFKPVAVMHGEPGEGRGKGLLRKILVVFQFTLSMVLVVLTLTIYKQTRYMQNKDVGFESEGVMYIRLFGDMNTHMEAIKAAFSSNPNVEMISGSNELPSGIGSNSGGINWDGKDPEFRPLVSQAIVDYDYPELLDIKMVEGRSFSRDFPSDMVTSRDSAFGSFMINETLAGMMELDQVVGTNMRFMGITGPIVGIMQDYHFNSMRTELPPLVLALLPPELFNRYLLFKINTQVPYSEVKASMENTWNTVMSEYPFQPHMLQEEFDRMYRQETRITKLLSYFTIMAIIIACLGLLGLASYMAEKRIREIGVRKTFGSTEGQIIGLMVSQFAKLVLIAMLLAIPASYFLLDMFLKDYPYRTDLSWWLFALPAAVILLISIATVIVQAIKASRTSPSVCLRCE